MNRKFCVSAAGVMAIGVLAVAGCKMSSAGATEQINVEGPVNYEITCPAEKYSELLPVSDTQDIPQIIMSRDWGAEDAYLLEKIAMAEAEGEDTEGKALVMLVVLNRVWSDDFPDSIQDVIYEEGQFTPVSNGRFDRVEPDEDCHAAMQLITTGQRDESQGALYFESGGGDTWHSRNLEFLFQHGGHYFYK